GWIARDSRLRALGRRAAPDRRNRGGDPQCRSGGPRDRQRGPRSEHQYQGHADRGLARPDGGREGPSRRGDGEGRGAARESRRGSPGRQGGDQAFERRRLRGGERAVTKPSSDVVYTDADTLDQVGPWEIHSSVQLVLGNDVTIRGYGLE